MIKQNDGLILTPEQQRERKQQEEAKQKAKVLEFKTKKEALMRETGVIEVSIIKMDPMRGIQPDSVILPYAWKDGETFLEVVDREDKKDEVTDKVANDIIKNGKKEAKKE